MKTLLSFLPLLIIGAIVLFVAARPKKGHPMQLKRGIGFLLVFLGALSLVGQLFIDPALGNAHVNVLSVLFAAGFVALGMFLARTPQQAQLPTETTPSEPK